MRRRSWGDGLLYRGGMASDLDDCERGDAMRVS